MPYGCLNSTTLSQASRKALDLALEQWQRSMQIYRPHTFLVLASYEGNTGTELSLKKEAVAPSFTADELSTHVVTVLAKNEEDLAAHIARNKTLMPIQTLILFAESRHLPYLRPIFRKKFGNAVEIKKFKADFEFEHPWISTASSLTWVLRNVYLRTWLGIRRRTGRRMRKKLKSLFRS
ncbi:MAG: hypothetical protein HY695_05610 [Deltaproteobacteria bacterium]|nr:hypothetical protein [Deltaproteobacteria bacterium]